MAVRDVADRGLLATLLELDRDASVAPTTENVAGAVGVPVEYADVLVRRLHENAERGLVDRDADGRWRLTHEGLAAAHGAVAPGSRA